MRSSADTTQPEAGLLVIVPAYNEAAIIGSTLDALKGLAAEILVVDDGSRDATAAIAAGKGAVVVRHVVNLGQGAALQTGLSYAGRSGCGHVCTFDADGQHDPDDARRLLQELRARRLDIALGSRFIGSTIDMPLLRRLVLKGAVLFTWLTLGVRLTDAHNGLRVMTVDAARRFRLEQNRMAYASELIAQIKILGMAYAEVPVTIRYTKYSLAKGQRNFGLFRILKDLMMSKVVR